RLQKKGESDRQAFKRILPDIPRSTLLRWVKAYNKNGFDGLIRWTMPPRKRVPLEIRTAICTLRQADQTIKVEAIIAHIFKHYQFSIGKTAVRKILHDEGLAQPRGRDPGTPHLFEKPLECGSTILVDVMDVHYDLTESVTRGIEAVRDDCLKNAPKGRPVDTSGRVEHGHFSGAYNERYRKKPGDTIGPGFVSIDIKRQDKDLHRLHLNTMSHDVIHRKVIASVMKPLISADHWDNLRAPQGNLLHEICGFPYMPSTVELFCRELKYLSVASTLWEVNARLWLETLRKTSDKWARQIFFIDGSSKPCWTELYSESTRVCSVGKIMPGLEVVCFHLGNGIPLWMTTHSGRMPLVRQAPYLLDKINKVTQDVEVGRIVVIDAEGNSIPFLKGLEQHEHPRTWVTRLKSTWVEKKRIFNRCNYRSYRNGDRIRMGVADFDDRQGGSFRMWVIEVERRATGTVTYLGASLLLDDRQWSVEKIADLYFDRWPKQEANFRAVNQATRFKNIHGYGKQLVDNVSVLTEYDRIANQLGNKEATAEQLTVKRDERQQHLHEKSKVVRKLKRRQQTVEQRLEQALCTRDITPAKIKPLFSEQKKLAKQIDKEERALERNQKKATEQDETLTKLHQQIDKSRRRIEELEKNRKIFVHDVEQDSLFNLFNVLFVVLIQLVIKELLGDAAMDPNTFIKRVATLPARSRKTSHLQIVTFEYNCRDPEIMRLLESRCEPINAMKLKTRSGKILRLRVDPPPEEEIKPRKK
ncbi:MAG: hypothetical protein ACYTFK_14035, partial [Planctomycetota bacterium]